MRSILSIRRQAQSQAVALLLLFCAATAYADSYDGKTLEIPTLAVGHAIYSDVAVTVLAIVAGPLGSSPESAVDTYNPSNFLLTVPNVNTLSAPYYNVQVVVKDLISIRSVTGADIYDGANLRIPYVQVGSAVYSNVVLAVSIRDVVSVSGGMPGGVYDYYNLEAGQLFIPVVQVGNNIYTNVTINTSPQHVVSIGEPPGVVQVNLAPGSNASLQNCPTCGVQFLTGSTNSSGADFDVDSLLNFNGNIVSMGPVAGLKGITAVPSSLSSTPVPNVNSAAASVAVQTGYGYVAESRDGWGNFYRIYVVSSSDSKVVVQYAPLSVLSSLQISPSGTLQRPAPTTSDNPGDCPVAGYQMAASGVHLDGIVNEVSGVLVWSAIPSPSSSGDVAPFISATGLVSVEGGFVNNPGACLTPTGSYLIIAAAPQFNAYGSTRDYIY